MAMIICAPMAGGPSTPELVAAVGRAGGFGYLAGGYLTAGRLREQITAVRGLGCERFGVNLFLPQPHSLPQSGERADVSAYRELLLPLASSLGAELPLTPDHDDDDYPAKLDLVLEMRPPVVSFTFGLPEADTVSRLQAAEVAVVITCTSAEEIAAGWASGADAMTVQGAEAGGHRATFTVDAVPTEDSTRDLLRIALEHPGRGGRPVYAAGGASSPAEVRALEEAGAAGVQLGTVFLWAREAGTKATHRRALTELTRRTVVTRVFSGRPARAVENLMTADFSAAAPAANPEVHHLTSPLRAAAAAAGDPERLNLWAGAGYAEWAELLRRQLDDEGTVPAEGILRVLAGGARDGGLNLV